MAKRVTVIKVLNIVYEVEGEATEEEAIEMVKSRMAVESPLGHIETKEDIQDYVVEEVL